MTNEMSRRERLEWRIEHSSRGADSAWEDVCGELRDLWDAQAIAESDLHQAGEWLDRAKARLQQEQEQFERAREAHIQTRNDLESRLQQEQEHSADLSRQLRIVREWMAEHGEGHARPVVRELSDSLLWADHGDPCPHLRDQPSPGAIAVTASLFERVAVLEDEMVKLGDRLHMLDGDLNRQIQSLTKALREMADIHPEGL